MYLFCCHLPETSRRLSCSPKHFLLHTLPVSLDSRVSNSTVSTWFPPSLIPYLLSFSQQLTQFSASLYPPYIRRFASLALIHCFLCPNSSLHFYCMPSLPPSFCPRSPSYRFYTCSLNWHSFFSVSVYPSCFSLHLGVLFLLARVSGVPLYFISFFLHSHFLLFLKYRVFSALVSWFHCPH